MPSVNDTVERVRSRAVELGLYLPLGAYSTVRDQISDVSRARINRLFGDLISRGQDRVQPIEKAVRKRVTRAQTRTRSATGRPGTTGQRTVRKSASKASATAAAVAPKLPRVSEPKRASDLPITSYDSLTADEVIARLRGLTQTDLAKVYKYERAHENRSTVLDAIDSRLVELPIPTYDALTVDEITSRLDNLSESELKTIRSYESETKMRSTVLEKIDSLLS
jgi:hypothetical protein